MKRPAPPPPSVAPARADGRPLYFDIVPGSRVSCYYANKNGLIATFGYGQAVMNDPANSPENDGAVHTMSLWRIPEDAVIFDPATNICRNKARTNFWIEHPDGSVSTADPY